MRSLIILGAGGHAQVLVDILRLSGTYALVGLLDPARVGQTAAGLPVLGGDELLPQLRAEGVDAALVGVGSTGDPALRIKLYTQLVQTGFELINALHPAALIAPSVTLGRGVAVMAGAIINPGSRLGDNVIVNTGAIVEHENVIGMHVHISPGAILCGQVQVGPGAHIGAGAVVRQGLVIGEQAVVGAGAVVVKTVLPRTVVVGVPARELRKVGV